MSSRLLISGLILTIVLTTIAVFSHRTIYIKNEHKDQPLLQRMYKEVGIRTITAYTLGRVEENDDSPCIGAYNNDLCELAKKGVQVCATREFPKGTLLRIGDIECIVLDKTSKKYANRVDVAMLNYDQAMEFGINELPVSVVEQGIK